MKALFVSSFCILIFLSATSFQPKDEWINLLDKGLSRWEIYQSFRFKVGYKGEAPRDEHGNLIKPIGYNINQDNVFTVIEENGEPALKVSGGIYGCVFTKQEFQNYDLKLKFKWGTKKWPPRLNEDKDSGLLYHSQGKCGVEYWRTWMLSQEFQIIENSIGDYWSQSTSKADVRAVKGANYKFENSGKLTSFGSETGNGNFCQAGTNMDKPGEWNEIELITYGDKSLHIVNGKVVMALSNLRYMDGNVMKPLVKGKLQLQSEAAEIYYKDIKIKQISGIPQEYAEYFK